MSLQTTPGLNGIKEINSYTAWDSPSVYELKLFKKKNSF